MTTAGLEKQKRDRYCDKSGEIHYGHCDVRFAEAATKNIAAAEPKMADGLVLMATTRLEICRPGVGPIETHQPNSRMNVPMTKARL